MKPMSEKNKELIQRINEEFANGDTYLFTEYLSPDIKWNIISVSTISGKKNILNAMEKQELETLPQLTIKSVQAEGDTVVVESSGIAKGRSGCTYCASYKDVYRLEDGLIKEFTTYVIEAS